jgi:hypothetical protein
MNKLTIGKCAIWRHAVKQAFYEACFDGSQMNYIPTKRAQNNPAEQNTTNDDAAAPANARRNAPKAGSTGESATMNAHGNDKLGGSTKLIK